MHRARAGGVGVGVLVVVAMRDFKTTWLVKGEVRKAHLVDLTLNRSRLLAEAGLLRGLTVPSTVRGPARTSPAYGIGRNRSLEPSQPGTRGLESVWDCVHDHREK